MHTSQPRRARALRARRARVPGARRARADGCRPTHPLEPRTQDVAAGRPAPYMVHLLMHKLEVDDVRAVAKAGDTERDIGEALHAGCEQAIGVLSGADSADALRACGATAIVENITRLRLSEV
jgi:phosphoglycolate phosphatase-like HAD superfamily hydrolase